MDVTDKSGNIEHARNRMGPIFDSDRGEFFFDIDCSEPGPRGIISISCEDSVTQDCHL